MNTAGVQNQQRTDTDGLLCISFPKHSPEISTNLLRGTNRKTRGDKKGTVRTCMDILMAVFKLQKPHEPFLVGEIIHLCLQKQQSQHELFPIIPL